MKKLISLFLASAFIFMTACGGKNKDNGEKEPANSENAVESEGQSNADGEITVAFIGTITGDYAQYGIPCNQATKLYFDQVNAKGGINGKKVNLLVFDDKGDGVEAVNALNLAVEKGATAVIGAVLTGPTIALADATYEQNMPQISGSATAAGVTQFDPENPDSEIRTNVFRSCFIDPYQGEKMAKYASEKLGAKTAGIFYQTGNDYSEGVKNAFADTCKSVGIEVVGEEAFGQGDKDFKAQMTNLSAKNPDVIFAPIYYSEAGLAIKASRAAGYKGTFLGADGFGSVKDYAEPKELEGTLYCSGYAMGSEEVAQFEKDYKDAFGKDVENMFAPLTYDACMLMESGLEAAEKAGLKAGTDEYKQKVIDTIKGTKDLKGVTGTYSFDKYNNPIKEVAIIELRGGEEVFKEIY